MAAAWKSARKRGDDGHAVCAGEQTTYVNAPTVRLGRIAVYPVRQGPTVRATNDSINFNLDTLSHQRSMMSNVVNLASACDNWEQDTETSPCGDWRDEVISTLKDSLIVELVCVVRYNHLAENSLVWPLISAEFLTHAYEKLAHANKLARRIAQLGGEFEYSPNVLMNLDLATHKKNQVLQSIIQANLASERKAVLKYKQIMAKIAEEDASTRSLLAEIVNDENEHAEELQEWVVN